MKRPRWTQEEDTILIEHIGEGIASLMRRLPSRKSNSIYVRARHLGVSPAVAAHPGAWKHPGFCRWHTGNKVGVVGTHRTGEVIGRIIVDGRYMVRVSINGKKETINPFQLYRL